ncbi:LPXTG cell wall anchor domain-containing protein [Serinibacter arcticus]|uniref:Glycoprotein gp2 n=1 Tax=Serinibacter arcticus TaxID=1655435 RepID=A0A4Z1E110_9MICO|nr:LPXTG cell wall anchor domain-containing protein [Serinibacter arcticus]TGO04929.1 Glycoprotein gp2 [Serinibacter arcticus]
MTGVGGTRRQARTSIRRERRRRLLAWIAVPAVCLTMGVATPAAAQAATVTGTAEQAATTSATAAASGSPSADPTWTSEPTPTSDPTPSDTASSLPTATPTAEEPAAPAAPTEPVAPTEPAETESAKTEPAETDVAPAPAARAAAPEVTTDAVQPRTLTTTTVSGGTVVVQTGGIRTSFTTVNPLPDGTRLGLFPSETSGVASQTCSVVAGACTFTNVPVGSRSWVGDLPGDAGANASYFSNPRLRTGHNEGLTGVGTDGANYRFQTPTIVAGQTYRSTTANPTFMANDTFTNTRASGGIWPHALDNPAVPAQCGLDVGIVVDLSGSISTSGGANSEFNQLKNAVTAFGNGLAGTTSTVTGYAFATTILTGGGYSLPSTSTAGGAGAVTSWASRLPAPTAGAATNWDRGLYQTASKGHDVVILLTDGNPTRYGTGQNQGSDVLNRFREVEEAVFSANAVKSSGTRVLALGVGSGVERAAAGLNLRAVSGPTRYSGSNIMAADYFQESSYASAAEALKSLALEGCKGTLTVVKKVLPHGSDDLTTAAPGGAGWTFTPTTASPVTVNPTTGTTDATSAALFDLNFRGRTSPATVQVAETLPGPLAGASYVRTQCRTLPDGAPADVPSTGSAFSVQVPVNGAISCTVYNRASDPGVDITVNKRWVVNGVDQPVNVMPAGTSSAVTVNGTGAAWGATTRVASGSEVTLAETRSFDAAAMPRCRFDGDPEVVTGTAAGVSMGSDSTEYVRPAGTTTYTIVNRLTCDTRLTLTKAVTLGSAAPAAWTLSATPPGGPALSGAGTVTGTVTAGVAHVLGEQPTGGVAQPSYVQQGQWSCTAVDPNGTPTGQAASVDTVTVPLGGWTRCTVTNATAELTLLKHVVSDSSDARPASDWTLQATPVAGTPALATQSVVGAETAVGASSTRTVRPGRAYVLGETGPGGYTQQLQKLVGSSWVAVDSTTVTLAAGERATYRFVNDDVAPSLTLTKVVRGGTAVATDWTLSATSGASATTFATGETKAISAGTYVLGESGPSGYTWQDLTCTGTTAAQSVSGSNPSLALSRGDVVACTYTNVAIPPQLALDKTVESVRQGADLAWTVTYLVQARNTGTVPTTYSLTDTPALGPELTAVSLAWERLGSGIVQDGALPTTQLATDMSIAVGATHTYRVVVTTAPTTAPPASPLTCDGEGEGGFVNEADLTYGGRSLEASACAEPASPSVTKTALTAVQDPATGTWRVAYDVAVTYPAVDGEDQPDTVGYTLSDAPTLPTGATLVGAWRASGPVPTGSGTLDATFDGGAHQHVADGVLAVGDTHTYRVEADVALSPDVTTTALRCTEGGYGGVRNTAVVGNGVGTDHASACTPITPPTVTVDKSVVGTPTQDADGHWTISYDVVVTNADADEAAVYRLVDTLDYGDGITVLGATWAPSAGGTPTAFVEDPPGTWRAEIVASGLLAPASRATFRVVVSADVDPAAFPASVDGARTRTDLTCESGGGFLNTAQVWAGGSRDHASACAEPSEPSVEKDVVSVVQDKVTGLWTLTTRITVTGGANPTVYSLTDTPALPTGVTVVSATVTGPDGDPAAWDGTTPLATTVPLGAGEVDVYTVAHVLRVTAIPAAERECDGTPGHGLSNAVLLSTGAGPADEDDACAPVTELVPPSVEKNVASATQDARGDWTIVYDVVVTQPEGEANPEAVSAFYDLTDDLDYGDGLVPTDATWRSDRDGEPSGSFAEDEGEWSAVLADDVVIEAGDVHTYMVTVTATVDPSAIDEDSWRCEGEGPGGFLNHVDLTYDGGAGEDDACTTPVLPELDKSDAVVTPAADGASTLTYTVTVSNPSSGDPQHDDTPLPWVRLTEDPAVITGADVVTGWSVVAVGDTPAPTATQPPGSGDWVLADGPIAAGTTWTYAVSVTIRPTTEALTSEQRCTEGGTEGVAVVNSATVAAGSWTRTDDGCGVVEVPDLGIVKTAGLPVGVEIVEAGDVFDYVLTVTNHGTGAVTGGVVTDDVPTDRLRVTGVGVPDGWSDESVGNAVRVLAPTLAVGASADVVVTVEVLAPPAGSVPVILAGEAAPTAGIPLDRLDNEACVAAPGDVDPSNDCDDVTVPLEEISSQAWVRCVGGAPYLGYSVTSSSTVADQPITLTWAPSSAAVPAQVVRTLASGDSGEIAWPGTVYSPTGQAVDLPGWRAMTAADLNPDGTLRAGLQTRAGLVRDTAEADSAWFGATTVTFSVNPQVVLTATYPQVPACPMDQHPAIALTKTASVEQVAPGGSFNYAIDVSNSGLGAATPLVLSDPIPASLKVTGITTSTEGFPAWHDCTVTGKNAAGYGGTLTCSLFGPLVGGASAPTVTVAVTVDPRATGTSIVNTATATWTNADVPSEHGTATGSDTVTLTHGAVPASRPGRHLPSTGAPGLDAALLAAAGLLLLGGVLVWRRRRGGASS